MIDRMKMNVFTERKKSITDSEAQLFMDTLTDLFLLALIDCNGHLLEMNDPYVEALGGSFDRIEAGHFQSSPNMLEALAQEKYWSGEYARRTKQDKPLWLKSAIIPITDHTTGETIQFLEIAQDITDLKEIEEWKDLAYRHELTRLPNRRMLLSSLPSYLEKAKERGSQLAILFMDINRFKQFNDQYGHLVGDEILKNMAERLLYLEDEETHIFHLSGDEFIIILEDVYHLDRQIEGVLSQFEMPFVSGDEYYDVTVSIGVSVYPDHGEDIWKLLNSADRAMYKLKKRVENTYHIYG